MNSMSDLIDYIDIDGLVGLHPQTEPKTCGSQNGIHYTGLAYVLTGNKVEIECITDFFDRYGYRRNSVTNDKMSYDDLHVLAKFDTDVRWDFIKRLFWHPAKESWALRWWFIRQPCFIVNVLFPFRKSIIRDMSIALTGIIGKADADSFKTSFLLSELYPTSEWAKRALRKRALKRFNGGLTEAFIVYFGDAHPLCKLMYDFERKQYDK